MSFQKQLQGCCAVSAHLQGAGCLKCSPASASSPGWETTTGYTHGTTFSKICHSTVKDCSKAKANAALRISIDHTTMFILESDELSDHFCSSISSVDYFDFTFESPSCPIKALNCNKAEQFSSIAHFRSSYRCPKPSTSTFALQCKICKADAALLHFGRCSTIQWPD